MPRKKKQQGPPSGKRIITYEQLVSELPEGNLGLMEGHAVYCIKERGAEDEERKWLYRAPNLALHHKDKYYSIKIAWNHESIPGFEFT